MAVVITRNPIKTGGDHDRATFTVDGPAEITIVRASPHAVKIAVNAPQSTTVERLDAKTTGTHEARQTPNDD
jgi:sRNA-binding carbon storage regulator CsrA